MTDRTAGTFNPAALLLSLLSLPLLDAFRNPTEAFRTEILSLKTLLEGAYSELAA